MKCSDCRTYIDNLMQDSFENTSLGSNNTCISTEVLDHINDCTACSLYYEMSLMIGGSSSHLPINPLVQTPEGLQDRMAAAVLTEIRNEESEKDEIKSYQGETSQSRLWWKKQLSKTQHWYKYLLASAVVLLMILPFVREHDLGFSPRVRAHGELAKVVLEVEIPEAETVVVVGDWNNWNPQTHHLARADQSGTWKIEMELEPGREYRYQFVIDGNSWIADPNAYLQVDDGFGGTNSVLEM